MIADPGATMTFVAGGALKPIGGHILSHASATRIFLRKGRAEERVAKLVDSPDRPESEASYKLDEGGWADVWIPWFWINDVFAGSSRELPYGSARIQVICESRECVKHVVLQHLVSVHDAPW